MDSSIKGGNTCRIQQGRQGRLLVNNQRIYDSSLVKQQHADGPTKTLLYFGHVPAVGAGSAIIVYRHLLRFKAAGWNIRILADWGQDHKLCHSHGWETHVLSHRKFWWPPFHPNSSAARTLRAWLWAGEVNQLMNGQKADAVLTYLSAFSDTLSIAAAGYARRYETPLATLVHDDARCFASSTMEAQLAHLRRQWIMDHSDSVHFASPELASIYRIDPRRTQILPPIPEGCPPVSATKKADTNAKEPLFVYAGNYWPSQLTTLARIASIARSCSSRLLCILKPNEGHINQLREAGAEWMQPFQQNSEALDFIKTNATALIASYSDTSEAMPWIRTSFPSKVIEYCHMGLPILIIAPGDSAIMGWARRNKYPLCIDPLDSSKLQETINQLKDRAYAKSMGELCLRFAKTEFDPGKIHTQLEQSLLKNAF